MSTKYNLIENEDISMALSQFNWHLDSKNNAVLIWNWPVNRIVKLMLVFEWKHDTEDIPDIETLLNENYPHVIIARDLTNEHRAFIPSGRRKFLICPGFFDDKSAAIYKPVYVTEWIYKRGVVTAYADYKTMPFSQFQKVSLKVSVSDEGLMPMLDNALSYSVYENKQLIGEYPLDEHVIGGGYHFYITKSQHVSFTLSESANHVLALKDA